MGPTTHSAMAMTSPDAGNFQKTGSGAGGNLRTNCGICLKVCLMTLRDVLPQGLSTAMIGSDV